MKRLIVLICLLPFLHQGHGQSIEKMIKVLIVDGFSNHDWKQTTMITKQILDTSELFEVSVSTAPPFSDKEAFESWDPKFSDFDVVIQNCNNINNTEIRWPERVEKGLEEYVSSGGGLYILHSANNAFAGWEEYNLMIGLGWRSENEGIALQIDDDGGLVEIPVGDGRSTYHGPRNDEVIRIYTDHAINLGFPKAWLTPDMELYKFARGPAENLTVLSYAKDEETGINWPVEWVVAYGQGTIYNSSMGHLWSGQTYPVSYRCVGFQTTMIRATEWLATGKVSYGVPENFPAESSVSLVLE